MEKWLFKIKYQEFVTSMGDLLLYLGITVVGYIIGSRLRNHKEKLSWTGRVQTAAITALVLLMGMRMGSNAEITKNLKSIGLSAFIMTVIVVIFSIGAVFIARKLMKIDKYGRLREAAGDSRIDEGLLHAVKAEEEEEKKSGNLMTVLIVIAVIIGMLIGYFVVREMFAGRMDVFDSAAGIGIKAGLCLLLVFVGLDLGVDGTVIDNFKKVGFRILVVPAAIIVGTLAGSVVSAFFIELSLKECLAVGSGFGWYTLAPGIIMEAGYLTASAVSFLHNVMRELLGIVFIPLVAKKIGYLETTAMPGAAAMDVCLPIVEKSTRSDIAVYSFVSGVILSILVPVFVPIIIG